MCSKSAYPGAAATGLNVVDHDFDAVLALAGIRARQAGLAARPRRVSCPIVSVCGGETMPTGTAAAMALRTPQFIALT